MAAFQACNFDDSVAFRRENPEISLRISRHALPDIRIDSVRSWLEDSEESAWQQALDRIKLLMPDLSMNLLSSEACSVAATRNCPPGAHEKYIYCKVRFGNSYKLYSYRTEDASLEVGDVVKVPVGKDGDIGYATIEQIGYFTAEDAPYPVDKTKLILGLHCKKANKELDFPSINFEIVP